MVARGGRTAVQAVLARQPASSMGSPRPTPPDHCGAPPCRSSPSRPDCPVGTTDAHRAQSGLAASRIQYSRINFPGSPPMTLWRTPCSYR